MKKFLCYILYPYLWFMLYYHEWFKNSKNGIKGFSEQYLSHLLQETLNKSKQLRQENERLKERKHRLEQDKTNRVQFTTIPADEYDTIKRKLHNERFYLLLITLSESYLTYIFIQIIIGRTQNLIDGALKFCLSFIITAIVIVVVEELIRQLMLLSIHRNEKKKGSIPALILFLLLTIVMEFMTYNFAQVSARDFEGTGDIGAAGKGLTLLSKVIPFVGGYLAYSFVRDFGPYRNTQMLNIIENEISVIEQQLKSNKEEEEYYFLMRCSDRYAVIHEFIIYKTNYDVRHSLQEECLQGHFCATREAFFEKAKEQYQKRLQEFFPSVTSDDVAQASTHEVYTKIIILYN